MVKLWLTYTESQKTSDDSGWIRRVQSISPNSIYVINIFSVFSLNVLMVNKLF